MPRDAPVDRSNRPQVALGPGRDTFETTYEREFFAPPRQALVGTGGRKGRESYVQGTNPTKKATNFAGWENTQTLRSSQESISKWETSYGNATKVAQLRSSHTDEFPSQLRGPYPGSQQGHASSHRGLGPCQSEQHGVSHEQIKTLPCSELKTGKDSSCKCAWKAQAVMRGPPWLSRA